MTNSWTDIKNTDLVVVMGGNAAEAHPCGFKWVTEAKARNKARLIVVDPRFTRSASVADMYAPIRTGTDIAFLGGLINYLLENDKIQHEYVVNYTDVSFIVKEGFGFENGLFNGYDADRRAWQAAVLTHVLPRVRDIRRLGSAALDLCRVAEGSLDAAATSTCARAVSPSRVSVMRASAPGILRR